MLSEWLGARVRCKRIVLIALTVIGLIAPATHARAAEPMNYGAWHMPTPYPGPMQPAVAALATGGAIAVGGFEDAAPADGLTNYQPSRQTWIYGETTGQWRRGPNTQIARPTYVRATELADGRVLVAGGGPVEGTNLRRTELLDVARKGWSFGPDLPINKPVDALFAFPSGRVALLMGDALFVSDPSLTRWAAVISNGLYPRFGSLLPSGDLFVVGAAGGSGVFSERTMAITRTAAIPASKRAGSTQGFVAIGSMTALPSGRVLAVNASYERGAWLFHPSINKWERVASPRVERFGETLMALPDRFTLLVGGRARNSCSALCEPSEETGTHLVQTVEVFDEVRKTWAYASESAAGIERNNGVRLRTGRLLFPAEKTLLYSPPNLTDRIAPVSKPRIDGDDPLVQLENNMPTRIYGTAVDADSGVRAVTVLLRNQATGATTMLATKLTCEEPFRHRCSWMAKVPLNLRPGPYEVSSIAVDRVRNRERPANARTVVLV